MGKAMPDLVENGWTNAQAIPITPHRSICDDNTLLLVKGGCGDVYAIIQSSCISFAPPSSRRIDHQNSFRFSLGEYFQVGRRQLVKRSFQYATISFPYPVDPNPVAMGIRIFIIGHKVQPDSLMPSYAVLHPGLFRIRCTIARGSGATRFAIASYNNVLMYPRTDPTKGHEYFFLRIFGSAVLFSRRIFLEGGFRFPSPAKVIQDEFNSIPNPFG